MPDPTTDAALDAELRHLAEALVAEAPDEVPPFPAASIVQGPGSFRRRPGRTAVAAAAAVVVALGTFALSIDGDNNDSNDGDDEAVSVIAANAGLEAAPQRLLLDRGTRELLADGEVVPLELAGLDGEARPLPGGGHVVVGVHPTDATYGLAVVNVDGTVEIERDIERSVLLGVTDTEAVLGRSSGRATILAHDLATGDERVVRRGVELDPDAVVDARWAIVGGDLVTVESRQDTEPSNDETHGSSDSGARTVVPGSDECTLRVTDLATGDESERPLDLTCQAIVGLQAAPDGRRAAVAYGNLAGRWPEQRLAVVDLSDGRVVDDELLGNDITCPGGGCPPEVDSRSYRGMAWASATTLHVALDDLDAPFDDPTVRDVTLR